MTAAAGTGVFDAYGRYYDLLYADKDYAAEADYVAGLLRTYGNGRQLVEFGSGTGRHGRLLAQHGYDVLGIERSAEMLAQARTTDGFRWCILGGNSPIYWPGFALSLVVAVFLWVGVAYFRRTERTFADLI